MIKKLVVFALIITIAFAVAAYAASSTGDPLVSLSYVNDVFVKDMLAEAEKRTADAIKPTLDDAKAKLALLDAGFKARLDKGLVDDVAAKIAARLNQRLYGIVELKKDDVVIGLVGANMVLTGGAATISGDGAVNISSGSQTGNGSVMAAGNQYLFAANGSSIKITSAKAVLLLSGSYKIVSAKPYAPLYTRQAQALNALNLFKGQATGFNLQNSATRSEGITMLLRLLGDENTALTSDLYMPFNDVAEWAVKYVSYAYSMGYTKGTSAQRFSGDAEITAEQYMTFILRALGYSDTNGDFTVPEALDKAVAIGIISQDQAEKAKQGFLRDHMVLFSYNGLAAHLKGQSITMAESLAQKGVFSLEDYLALKF